MEKTMYHFTAFDAETNDVIFEKDVIGENKNYCLKMLDYELMDRKLYMDKLDGKVKIKAERKEVKKRTVSMVMAQYGYNIKRLSERFGIPYRTVQNWNSGTRECPDYIIRMMDEILSNQIDKN